MPSFSSSVDRSADAGFSFSSELPVASVFAMLPFFPHALKVRKSLEENIAANGGLCSYELVADLRAKRFTVSSTWTDEAAFRAWVGADVHVTAMRRLSPKVDGGTFTTDVLTPKPS